MRKKFIRNNSNLSSRGMYNQSGNITSSFAFPYYLNYGMTGPNIEWLQKMLVGVVNVLPSLPVLNIDGVFGRKTKEAVIEFQKLQGLPITGNVDNITFEKLNELYKLGRMNEKNYIREEFYDMSANVIKQGDNNKYVVDLQESLNKISLKYPIIPMVNVDGNFGEKTKEAVLAFQKNFNLQADGVVGTVTWMVIDDVLDGKKIQFDS